MGRTENDKPISVAVHELRRPLIDSLLQIALLIAAFAAVAVAVATELRGRAQDLEQTKFLARQQAQLERHQRLLLLPATEFEITTAIAVQEVIGVFIVNNGLGPARIQEVKYALSQKLSTGREVRAAAGAFLKRGRSFGGVDFLQYYVRPGEKVALIAAPSSAVDPTKRDALFKFLREQVAVGAFSCSVYEECGQLSLIPKPTSAAPAADEVTEPASGDGDDPA